MSETELQKDIDEIKSFISQSQRLNIKNVLLEHLSKLEAEYFKLVNQKQQQQQSQEVPKKQLDQARALTSTTGYVKKIDSYGWDQSDKFCKIYITNLKDLNKLKQEDLKCEFTHTSFDLKVCNLNGVTFTLAINDLLHKIDPSQSSVKLKTDMITIMLRKVSTDTWSCLTQKEQKTKETSKPKLDEKADPQDGLMSLMKKMYEEGDDEMKKTIAKAWTESRDKQQGGMGMGGLDM